MILRPSRSAPAAVLVVAVLVIAPATAWAQRLNVTPYTTAHGLPDQSVRAVLQDSEGFIWVATAAGVAIYDGNRFETLTEKHGLADNDVRALAEDPSGRVIVGTARGISVFVGRQLQVLEPVRQLVGALVRDIASSPRGVWVVTTDALVETDLDPAAPRTFSSHAIDALTVASDQQGGAYVAGHGFVRHYSDGAMGPKLPGIHTTVEVSDLVVDEDGRFWLATNSGLYRQMAEGFERLDAPALESLRSRRLHTGVLAADGSLWFGAWGGALHVAEGNVTMLTEANGLPQATVRAIASDVDGTVWLGTDRGLAKLVPGPFATFTTEQGLPSDVILDLAEGIDGTVWLATERGVVALRDGHVRSPVEFFDLRSSQPTAIAVDAHGRVMVGTQQGLYVAMERGLARFRRGSGLPSSRITVLAESEDDTVWVGTRPGIARWRDGRLEIPPALSVLSTASVTALLPEGSVRLWIATERSGLHVYDLANETLTKPPEPVADADVLSLGTGSDGAVWIGLAGDGAVRVAGDATRQLTTDNGLADNFVRQILGDNHGRTWVYTNRGLDRFEADGSVTHFGAGDGLPALDGSIGAALRSSDGRLWFGTARGVTSYDPELVPANSRPPAISIVGAWSDGSVLADQAELPPDRDALIFEYAALSYRNESTNRFVHRLLGLDDEWSSPVAEHRVSYGHLGPGKYTFEVRAINSDGVVSSEPARLSFGVAPAWYETYWYRGLAILSVFAAAYIAYRLRARRLERDRNRLASLVTRRSNELAEQIRATESVTAASRAKSEFLAKTSHEIRTPINGVLGMADLLMFTALTPRQRHLTRTINQSGQSLLDLINDILDASKIEAGKLVLENVEFQLVDTIGHVMDILSEKAKNKSLELQCKVDPFVPTDLVGDPTRLRQVLLNLVDNAIKFTEEGHVTLLVDLHDAREGEVRVRFRVEDSGIGIPPAAQESIFEAFEQADSSTTRTHGGSGLGLNIARQLTAAMGGELRVSSQLGKGTSFWFTARFKARSQFQPRETLDDVSVLLAGLDEREASSIGRQLHSWHANVRVVGSEKVDGGDWNLVERQLELCDVAIVRATSERARLSWLRQLRNHHLRRPVLLMVSPGAPLLDIEEAAGPGPGLLHAPPGPRRLYAALRDALEAGADGGGPRVPTGQVAALFSGHVLLAEDHPVNTEIAVGMLEAAGCTVEHAANGAGAAASFAAGRFDLVLMDCEMPLVDGFEATRRIRRFEREENRPRTPIVAVTASAIDEVRQQCLEAGMDGFLTKPHTLPELSDVLGGWLQTRDGDVVAESSPSVGPESVETDSLDPRALAQIHALQQPGEASLLDRVIGSFLENALRTRADLQAAVQYGDAESVRTAAHGLKAAAGNVGAQRTMSLCRRLEALGRSGDLGSATALLGELDTELEVVTRLLGVEGRKVANG